MCTSTISIVEQPNMSVGGEAYSVDDDEYRRLLCASQRITVTDWAMRWASMSEEEQMSDDGQMALLCCLVGRFLRNQVWQIHSTREEEDLSDCAFVQRMNDTLTRLHWYDCAEWDSAQQGMSVLETLHANEHKMLQGMMSTWHTVE